MNGCAIILKAGSGWRLRTLLLLKRLAGGKQLFGTDSGPQAGWLQVAFDPARIGEISRALAEGGIYATGLEAGSDLETVFLQLTHGAQPAPPPGVAAPGSPTGPPSPLPPPGSVPPQ